MNVNMETLQVIMSDIYNPVIYEQDTKHDDNRRFIIISKMIENLHDEKINEILTINYVLNRCKESLNMSQTRILQSLMKDRFFQIPLKESNFEAKMKELMKDQVQIEEDP